MLRDGLEAQGDQRPAPLINNIILVSYKETTCASPVSAKGRSSGSSRSSKPARKPPTCAARTASVRRHLYSWRSKYGGLETSDLIRLKQLEEENRRLKNIVADQALNIEALKIVAEGNY